jgi:hypothetical protein
MIAARSIAPFSVGLRTIDAREHFLRVEVAMHSSHYLAPEFSWRMPSRPITLNEPQNRNPAPHGKPTGAMSVGGPSASSFGAVRDRNTSSARPRSKKLRSKRALEEFSTKKSAASDRVISAH